MWSCCVVLTVCQPKQAKTVQKAMAACFENAYSQHWFEIRGKAADQAHYHLKYVTAPPHHAGSRGDLYLPWNFQGKPILDCVNSGAGWHGQGGRATTQEACGPYGRR